MTRPSVLVLVLLLAAIAVSLAACGTTPPPPTAQPLSEIRVSGAWALHPLMVRWAQEYQEIHADVQVGVWAGGSGKGLSDVLESAVDIGMVSREMGPEEEKRGVFWVPVARDAVVPVANSANPAASELAAMGLTRDQLAALWLREGDVTWGSLVGRPGIQETVLVCTRSDVCGAAEAWAQYLGGHREKVMGLGVRGDPHMVSAVQQDHRAIGYVNLNYAYDADTGLPAEGLLPVPIDGDGDRRIRESERFYRTRQDVKDAIASGLFPSPPARVLYLVTKGQPQGLTRDFIQWVLTEGQSYVDEAGYVELPQGQLDDALAKAR